MESVEKIIEGIKKYFIEIIILSGFMEVIYDFKLVEKIIVICKVGYEVFIYSNGFGLRFLLID